MSLICHMLGICCISRLLMFCYLQYAIVTMVVLSPFSLYPYVSVLCPFWISFSICLSCSLYPSVFPTAVLQRLCLINVVHGKPLSYNSPSIALHCGESWLQFASCALSIHQITCRGQNSPIYSCRGITLSSLQHLCYIVYQAGLIRWMFSPPKT